MGMLEHAMEYKYNTLKVSDFNFKSLNLCDGINHFPPPYLYEQQYIQEVNNGRFIQEYSYSSGDPALVSLISCYEKMLGSDDLSMPDNFADNICITAGATASIIFFIEYFSNKYSKSKVLLLGLNYYLFFVNLERYGLEYKLLCSHTKGRIAPTVEEIINTINQDDYKLVVLTMPMNPSGETYNENELNQIISALKEKEIFLLYDKCQDESGIDMFTFSNINRIIVKHNFGEYAIIVNSLSKTRSIPGARIGYVLANKEIIDYVTFMNEMTYYNPPYIYVSSFTMDLIYRILHFKMNQGFDLNNILSSLRKIILLKMGFKYYTDYISPIFKDKDLLEKVTELYAEINNNYSVIHSNYSYVFDNKNKYLYDITKLQGGYNFCIKFVNTKSREQIEFCKELAETTGIGVFPEYFFNNFKVQDNLEPFWVRITASSPHEGFVEMIDNVTNYIEKINS